VTLAINSFNDVALPPTKQLASRKQSSEERMQYLMLKCKTSLHKSDLEKVNILSTDIMIMFKLLILSLFDQETPPKPHKTLGETWSP
jgi:hypothetical protein